MNDYIEILYQKKVLKTYIMEIIQAEDTAFFLPVSFIEEKEKVRFIYKVRDAYPLRLAKEFIIDDVLNFTISYIRGIQDAERHYIFPEDYNINLNLVYADSRMEKLKAGYVPAEQGDTAEKKILELLYFFESRVKEEEVGYIFQLEKYLAEEARDYRSFERYIYKMRREISENGII